MDLKKARRLINQAKAARIFSQAKYSNFKVGAALETIDGEIYSGCNVESSSYGLSICAERVAITKAISEGKKKFKSIAIIGPDQDYCPPCGACRQLLYDYAPDITVLLTNGKEIKEYNIKELLPIAFDEAKLVKK
ncbi:cytidine deaminase [miscellaneous Crenarchaeota group archaeon SMTZ-80]|nr:MAG: cytidine deaminase [miscellaneous Crenarchaeota group archaeon SMTZ-80]